MRNIDTSGFETQHCELGSIGNTLNGDDCDDHPNDETNGYIAIDEATVDNQVGMEAGTLLMENNDVLNITFSENFDSTPYVFAQAQTSNGNQQAKNVQVQGVTPDNATLQFCEQEDVDVCDTSHTSEEVAWWAVDPSLATKGGVFDWGIVAVDDSTWNQTTFDTGFGTTPSVIAMPQTGNGGQEALYPEVKGVDATGASVRYCEYDLDDSCDSHVWESVAWIAAPPGDLLYENSGDVVRVEGGDIDSSGGNGDTGVLRNYSSATGTGPIEVTYKYCNLASSIFEAAEIETVIDGVTVDAHSFTTPYADGSGDDFCSDGEATTYRGHSFTVNRDINDYIRFDYTNGDWRISIADIVVSDDGGETDHDGDGVQDVEENVVHRTDPFDTDTDDDEFLDLEEADAFRRPDIVCGTVCEPPNPIRRDIYLEVDGWSDCDSSGANCDTHRMSDAVRDGVESTYAAEGIRLHADNGDLGGGGQTINGPRSVSHSTVESYEDDPSYFDSDREGVFHQMIWVHFLDSGACGFAHTQATNPDGDFAVVAEGDHFDGTDNCENGPNASTSEAVEATTLEEVGHNDLAEIEPSGDQCDTFHDVYDQFAIECGSYKDQADFESTRWDEYWGDPAPAEPNPDEGNPGDSPGDTNNGLP